jgi:hypothetical protein
VRYVSKDGRLLHQQRGADYAIRQSQEKGEDETIEKVQYSLDSRIDVQVCFVYVI